MKNWKQFGWVWSSRVWRFRDGIYIAMAFVGLYFLDNLRDKFIFNPSPSFHCCILLHVPDSWLVAVQFLSTFCLFSARCLVQLDPFSTGTVQAIGFQFFDMIFRLTQLLSVQLPSLCHADVIMALLRLPWTLLPQLSPYKSAMSSSYERLVDFVLISRRGSKDNPTEWWMSRFPACLTSPVYNMRSSIPIRRSAGPFLLRKSSFLASLQRRSVWSKRCLS